MSVEENLMSLELVEVLPFCLSPPLESLPCDILLRVVSHLDGKSLARFVESTSLSLRLNFSMHEVDRLWAQQYSDLKTCLMAHPYDGELPHSQRCSLKNMYVRSWAALQTRCPRCGRQSIPSRKLDGTIDTNRYMHLCDWLR